jgi:hypothetical protein
MFALFKNDELVNFWSNLVGDVFIAATCRNLKMDEGQVDLVHFISLESIPEHFEFSSSKQLIVKEKHVEIVEIPVLDEQGNPVLNEQGNPLMSQQENVSFSVKETLEPEVFFAKGLMVKPC